MARASTKTPRVRVSRQRGTKSSCGVEHEIRYTHDKEFLHLLQRFPPSLEGFTLTPKKKRSDAPYTKTELVQTQESKDHMWMEGGNVYFTRALDSAQFLTENNTKMKKNPATEREKVARELDGKLKAFSLSKANPLLLLLLKRYAISHRNSLKLLYSLLRCPKGYCWLKREMRSLLSPKYRWNAQKLLIRLDFCAFEMIILMQYSVFYYETQTVREWMDEWCGLYRMS